MNNSIPIDNRLTENEMVTRLRYFENKYGPYVEKPGLHNWKNLFKKPTMMEWIVFVMLVMGLFLAWSYKIDIQACHAFYNETACDICNHQRGIVTTKVPNILPINILPTTNITTNILPTTNITIKEEIKEGGG